MAEAAAQQEPSSEDTAAEVIELDLEEAEVISPAGEFEEMIATKEQERLSTASSSDWLQTSKIIKRARRESEGRTPIPQRETVTRPITTGRQPCSRP